MHCRNRVSELCFCCYRRNRVTFLLSIAITTLDNCWELKSSWNWRTSKVLSIKVLGNLFNDNALSNFNCIKKFSTLFSFFYFSTYATAELYNHLDLSRNEIIQAVSSIHKCDKLYSLCPLQWIGLKYWFGYKFLLLLFLLKISIKSLNISIKVSMCTYNIYLSGSSF